MTSEDASIHDDSIAAAQWRDRKRYWWPLALLIPMSPFVSWLLVEYLHWGLFWATGAWILLLLVPLVDYIAGSDGSSPPRKAIAALQVDRYYRWCTYLFVPLQYAGLLFACWCWVHAPMATGEKIALAMTVGVVAGVGINAAHELGHKSEIHERWLAKIVLAQSLYGHFYVEHNHGHHVNVVTPQEPGKRAIRGIVLDVPSPQRVRRLSVGLGDRICTPAPTRPARAVVGKQHHTDMGYERGSVRIPDRWVRMADRALAFSASIRRRHLSRGSQLSRTLRIAQGSAQRWQIRQSQARRQLEQ